MYCTSCGTSLAASARFCSHCGKSTGVPPPFGETAPRRLYRLRSDKMIAGLCSGLARYLDMDVSFLRILVVAILIVTGILPVALAYLIGWIIVPVEEFVPVSRPAPAEMQV